MDAGFQDRWIKPLSHPSGIFDFNDVGRTPGLKLTAGTFSTETQPRLSVRDGFRGQAVSGVVFAGAALAFQAQAVLRGRESFQASSHLPSTNTIPDPGSSGFDSICTVLYTLVMKLSISQVRKRLPELVRHVRKDPGSAVKITVQEEVVAELRATLPEPEPGAAAKKLLKLIRKLPKHRGAKTNVSGRVKAILYGSAGAKR